MRFNTVYSFVFMGFLFAILIGCATGKGMFGGTKKIAPEDYSNWYFSHKDKLTDTLEAKKVRFTLEEVPVEFDLSRMLMRQQMTLEDVKQAYIDESNNKSIAYRLTVELPTVGEDVFSYNVKPDESNRATYLSFQLKQHISLILTTGDTVECAQAIIERGISNHPRSIISLNFSLVDRSSISTLLVNDRFWSDSRLVFDIRSFQTIHIPQLAL